MRQLTAQELIEFGRCRRDPSYFLKKYGFIKDPVHGKISFELFRYQEICVNQFLTRAFNIILKSRQMGLSWLVAGYALWLCMFFEDKNVLMISIKNETAKALLRKVKFIYDNLPEFLQVEQVDVSTNRITWINGSQIQSVPTSEDAGRSESLSLLIIDEAAFVRWMDEIWMAAYPTLSTGGQAIILSTANGMGNEYHTFWEKAVEGKSLFHPIRLHWYYHPHRDLQWLKIQKANMNALQFAQEIIGDFITSGNLVFDITQLRAMQEQCSTLTPLEVLYGDEIDTRQQCGLYIFEKPNPKEHYILAADVAKGGAGDYSAAHVIKRSTGLQVAEYRTRVAVEVFNTRLLEIGYLYNTALLAPENNNQGITTVLHAIRNGYPNFYEYENPLNGNKTEMGFPTNTLTRPILIDKLETGIREGVAGVQGIRTVNEMMSFAWSKQGKAEAMSGKNDDLVISYGIARYVREMSSVGIDMPVIFA